MSMAEFYRYWGKAHPDGVDGAACHRLVFHSLDVAAVGAAWWDTDDALRRRVTALLGTDDESARALILRLLAAHDLGKFTGSFQALSPEAAALVGASLPENPVRGQRHDALSHALWRDHIRQALGIPAGSIGMLFGAFAGHHGRPAQAPQAGANRGFDVADADAALAFFRACGPAMGLPKLAWPVMEDEGRVARATWFFAGLAVACDWIGSNQEWFAYRADTMPLDEYWHDMALPCAKAALAAARIVPSRFAPMPTIESLLPADAAPTPLQCAIARLPLSGGPQLQIIEDLTGAGKTEAALLLAGRMIAAGLGDGLFFALPTQATANAMWRRIGRLESSLIAPDAAPTVVLAHGARGLVEDRTQPRLTSSADTQSRPAAEPTATHDAVGWIADDMRKATLADIGIGTVDQAVLAVFPEKFQSLRLMGVARKILILDEVHAYDAYMCENIAKLLRFQAALGGSAILLSATLSAKQRRDFAAAFREGLDLDPTPYTQHPAPFPQLVTTDCAGTRALPVAAAPRTRRTIDIVRLAPDEALARVVELARAGACVCWLRNTVGDVIAAATALGDAAPEIPRRVFHARFAMADRLAIETGLLRDFGPASSGATRRGQVVVASQVAEQSLDVDFDEMVTDLAPIDLLIQRAGRVHRHARPGREGGPRLHVVMPPWSETPGADWYAKPMRGSAFVYSDPGIVWRTARLLIRYDRFVLPEMVRELIEGVYAVDADTPEGLRGLADKAEGKRYGDRATAFQATLPLEKGYVPGPIWTDSADTMTRLGEPQVTLRLAILDGEALRPWADHPDRWRAWKLSEVKIRLAQFKKLIWSAPIAARMETVRQVWPDRDDPNVVALPLIRDGEFWMVPIEVDSTTKLPTYSQARGLIL
jgi:CRISPR-associated endonuclease/helicase Cas3